EEGSWKATDARDKARELKRLIDDGGDPMGEVEDERAAPTVPELIERFKAEHVERKRPSTIAAYGRILDLHVGPHFGRHVKVTDVRSDHIDALHRKLTKAGSLYVANRTVAVLSKMFSLAVRWRMRDDNPAKGVERNYETKRKRYLSADELSRLS